MVSFQHKLAAGLARRGIEVCYDLEDRPYSAVLVIGGTRNLAGLWRARRQGIRLVQRLDGMNWLHRKAFSKNGPKTGLRHFIRAEYGNWLLAWVRNRLADFIVYQSEFSRNWWERTWGIAAAPNTVIYNGVDLDIYTPAGPERRPPDQVRLLLVEGSLMGGYEMGLQVAIQLGEHLDALRKQTGQSRVELMVVGRVTPALQAGWQARARVPLAWAGLVSREGVPGIDRTAHLLYSADIHPACPNSVIEALACGLPVVAFDTGALPELVGGEAGRVAPYGGDAWQLQPPDVPALALAAQDVLANMETFRRGARERAEAMFGLEEMVQKYLQVLIGE